MKILEAELKNFGNFVDEKLSFHDGINVVWAKNGAGKSTIHEFILAMFYGLKGEECIRWQSWNGNGCLSGKLRFESGGKTYLLERDFLDGKNKGHLHCETDDQELSVEEDLPELLGNMSENAWKNTLYVTQRGPNIGKELASELKNYLGNLSGKGHIDVSHAQEKLEKQQDELEWEKKQAQADLISRQQEIRMKMDYIEQDIERLKKEQEDSLESLRLLKEAKAREDQEFARKQERAGGPQTGPERGRPFHHAGSRPFRRGRDLCASDLGESPSLCGGRPSWRNRLFLPAEQKPDAGSGGRAFQSPGILKKSSLEKEGGRAGTPALAA